MVAEVKSGIQNIDHIAIPVRDLPLNQAFYVDVLGLKYKTTRRNPDGTPRQTYVLAGNNIIGLHLPGVQAPASASSAPRIGISLAADRFEKVRRSLSAAGHEVRGPVEHAESAPFVRSLYFDDPDGNHLEICVRRKDSIGECISHTVFETRDLGKAIPFYTEALGTGVPVWCGDEVMIPVQTGQMIGLLQCAELSERSKKHGRGCHMAMDVTQEDFDSMVLLAERHGGKAQGDKRADDGLRPEGERSLYLFDPDNNRLQITAHGPHGGDDLLPDDEKWRRIIANRKEQGRGLTRWESGGKKFT